MTPRRTVAAARAATALVTAFFAGGCMARVGPTRTETVEIPTPGDVTLAWDVELQLVGADATVSSDGDALVEGTIAYNLDGLKPAVSMSGHRVRIAQDFRGRLPNDAHNEWRLRLGRRVPLNLWVNTGVSRGEWDLGGLALRRLNWMQGAAAAELFWSRPNRDELRGCAINGGAAALRVRGLANANFRKAYVVAGVGALALAFDGRLSQDAEVVLAGGTSVVTIDSGGNPVRLVSEGILGLVTGTRWSREGGTWLSPEWTRVDGPRITVRARLGLATVHLVVS